MIIDILGYRDWARKAFDTVEDRARGHSVHWDRSAPCAGADLIYAVGWSEMIDAEVWRQTPVLVVHPSALPDYRGGSPIQHQIMDGRSFSCVTIFKIDEDRFPGVDTGPIAWQQAFSLAGTLDDVLDRIAQTTARGILDTMALAARDELVFVPQRSTTAEVRKRRTPEMSEITTAEIEASTARQLYDKIRALQEPYPLPFLVGRDGEKVFITGSRLEE